MKLALATLLLVVAGCSQGAGQPTTQPSAAVSPPAPSSPQASSAGDGIAVVVKDFSLDPKDVSATGSTVSLAVENAGPTVHNVTIRDESGAVLMATRDLRPGESETISGKVAAGTYVMFCSLPGHESLGIKGKLIVAP